jgi:hypothetical protein
VVKKNTYRPYGISTNLNKTAIPVDKTIDPTNTALSGVKFIAIPVTQETHLVTVYPIERTDILFINLMSL